MRASDDTREQAVAELRSGLLEGRLGVDTFVARVGRAYGAQDRRELNALTIDLPGRFRRSAWLRRIAGALGAPSREAAPAALRPPRETARDSFLIGRAAHADFLVADPTVSARHAMLRRSEDGEWTVSDLGSLNGTRVNGWLAGENTLRAGDVIAFGAAEFTVLPD